MSSRAIIILWVCLEAIYLSGCASDPPRLTCDEMVKQELAEGQTKSQAIHDGLECTHRYGQ